MIKMEIDKNEIIEILNYARDRSFALTKYNQIAIYDRGQFPLNQNLLCNKEIYSTMKNKDIELDKDVPYKQKTINSTNKYKKSQEFDKQYLLSLTDSQDMAETSELNLSSGLTGSVIQCLFHQVRNSGAG